MMCKAWRIKNDLGIRAQQKVPQKFQRTIRKLKKQTKSIKAVDSINYSCHSDKFNFKGLYGDLLCRDISENYYKFM